MLGIKRQYIHCNIGNRIGNRTTIYTLGIESNNNMYIENRAIKRQLLIKFRSLPFQFRRPMLTSFQQLAENGEHNRRMASTIGLWRNWKRAQSTIVEELKTRASPLDPLTNCTSTTWCQLRAFVTNISCTRDPILAASQVPRTRLWNVVTPFCLVESKFWRFDVSSWTTEQMSAPGKVLMI